jgi:hypothetical protein
MREGYEGRGEERARAERKLNEKKSYTIERLEYARASDQCDDRCWVSRQNLKVF